MKQVISSNQTQPPQPLTKIRPSSLWQAINFREIWKFRDLILILAGRDIKLRYRQAAMGIAWVVIQPLVGAAIFAFLSEVIAKTPTDGTPRFLFTFTGFIAWTAFSSTLTKVSSCLLQNSNLVSKVYFPRLVLPLSTVISVLIDFIVGLIVMFAFMLFWKIGLTINVLLMPVWLLLILMMALGVGLIAAGLSAQYRDVQYVLPVMIQFLLFISPVWYPRSAMPEKYHLLYNFNPLSGLLDAFRWSLLPSVPVDWGAVVYSGVLSLGVLLIGAYFFRSMERRFADVI